MKHQPIQRSDVNNFFLTIFLDLFRRETYTPVAAERAAVKMCVTQ
jgi:hypothetical protein